jgi:predicted enzyme related to lactoylglutathione lyase/uncharacterized protein YbaA (DUF1428 family)
LDRRRAEGWEKIAMTYVDGFVIAVPTANKQMFIDQARKVDGMFMKLGALRILECWGDDVPEGKTTDFRMAVKASEDETVVFSWVEWPDKATRDAAAAKMHETSQDEDWMNPEKTPMSFDGSRLIYGGFQPIVTLNAAPKDKPGDFIWYELLTSDADAAQTFYGDILGWSVSSSGMEGMDYRIVHVGPNPIGGMMTITQDMADHGARPTWLGYLTVANADETVAGIKQRGGNVLMGPMDLPNVGRIAMVADPQGAPFYVMQPLHHGKSLAFADDTKRAGHCAWNELVTSDQSAAWRFYGELFGWAKDGEMDMGPMGTYQFIRHGAVLGAMAPASAQSGQPHWNQYFRVHDIDRAKGQVEAGGGTVVNGPHEIPGGDFAMQCVDPQGAPFALVGGRFAC